MTSYKLISEAKRELKGSIVAKLVSLGELKSGHGSDGKPWQKQTGILKDNSEAIEITFWNEDIGRLEQGKYFFIENPFWKTYKEKPQLSLGKFAVVSEATEKDLLPVDGSSPAPAQPAEITQGGGRQPDNPPQSVNDEYLKRRQQEILANMPSDAETKKYDEVYGQIAKCESYLSTKMPNEDGARKGLYLKLMLEALS